MSLDSPTPLPPPGMVGSHLLLPIPFQPLLLREYTDILQQQFTKRFTFPPCSPPVSSSPPYSSPYWSDTRLQTMKDRLNQTKSQLNTLPLAKWHKHTRQLNPAGSVTSVLRKSVQPELLTQAWQKFHECFHVFDLGPDKEQLEFNSVHLCEAPGAFVTSLNHALCLHHQDVVWNWVATTLNPHYEGNDLGYMINDDRFIMGTLDNWHFGEDNTGNLLDKVNMSSLLERAGKLGESGLVHLVTADGSVDCQSDPARQESIVSDLHMAEAVMALKVLAEGGSLVIKMFTVFESESVCLLYLLACAFTTLDMFKPATSKEGNSEVYLVGKGLKRSDWLEKTLEQLTEYFGQFPSDKSLFDQEEIPDSFLANVKKCGELFMQLQENVISNNLHYWQEPLNGNDTKDLAEIQTQVAERYVEEYKVEEIAGYRHCVYRRRDAHISQIDSRTDRGTFMDKVAEISLQPEVRLANIRTAMQGWKVKGRVRFVEWVQAPKLGKCLDTPTIGKKFDTVLSSKFCTGRHLQFYNETLKLLETVDEDDSKEGGGAKRRRVEKVSKPYQGSCKKLADYREDVRILKKLSAIFPEIVPISKVLFLSGSSSESNMLSDECKPENQTRLIGTIIEAVTGLEKGQHLLVQGFPLHTRLNNAIFYCLAALFEETGFVKPAGEDDFIFLSNFLGSSNTADESISSLETILTVLYNHKGPDQVLSVWSVGDLVQDQMYQEIILFNQTRIKEKILHLTKFLEPPADTAEKEEKERTRKEDN
eukprot:GFUD01044178.1.p1 GENE.GFUD01044178.1~~GFUD01044178.1.p1  ORF type:complete len:760 (-),score=259.24 GFUD01044178.1:200-2479(-)